MQSLAVALAVLLVLLLFVGSVVVGLYLYEVWHIRVSQGTDWRDARSRTRKDER